jgi:hypothetical protein
MGARSFARKLFWTLYPVRRACALVMKDMGEGQIAVGPQARVLPRLGPRIDYEALAGLKQPTGN